MAGVWLTDLADVLRAAGVSVIEETYVQGRYKGLSWKQVGFGGRGLTSFDYILWHHDASPANQDSPGALAWMMYYAKDGNYDLTPAAAAWVCSSCHGKHPSGTWHLYASGLSNHAGRGGPWTPTNGQPHVARDGMNARSWAVEVDHTFGESWDGEKKQAQLNSLRRGTAAVLAAYEMPPERVIRHLDWTNGLVDGVPRLSTYGRKNDIDGLNLANERRILADLIRKPAAPDQTKALKDRLAVLIANRSAARKAGDTVRLERVRTRIKKVRARLKKITGK
jgi:hypothetical protein